MVKFVPYALFTTKPPNDKKKESNNYDSFLWLQTLELEEKIVLFNHSIFSLILFFLSAKLQMSISRSSQFMTILYEKINPC